MAPGGTCPRCGYYLLVKEERWEKYGVTVWYQCANLRCGYAIKTFIPSHKLKYGRRR